MSDPSRTTPVAVVTGAGGGMGLATARHLAATHSLVLTDFDGERLATAADGLRADGATVVSVPCDVTDRNAVDDVARIAGEAGPVTAVVHAAGVSPTMGGPERIVRINALGTVNVNDAFAAPATAGFSIVNVASTAGRLPSAFPLPRRGYRLASRDPDRFVEAVVARCRLAPSRLQAGLAYAISKNFVIWWSQRLAVDVGARGARVVSVSPGSFDTDMGRLEERGGAGELAARSALGRYGRVDEIAAVLAFLASDGPGYLTGTDVLVDGGANAAMTWRDTLAMARAR